MKSFKISALLFGLSLFSCTHVSSDKTPKLEIQPTNQIDDIKTITNLIRNVYNWHEAQKPSDNDMISEGDSIYTSFNLDQLKLDIKELKEIGLFADEFIDNYNKIYLTLDQKLKNKEFAWRVGELPPYGNDANPWCNCQDLPYDYPNPWDFIEVEVINLDKTQGELYWKWGKPELNEAPGWKEFTYKFRVVKENGEWRIAYLEGFDLEDFTRIPN